MKKEILALILVAILFCSCGAVIEVPENTSNDGLKYNIVTIEGMPCLLVQNYSYGGNIVKSITCDWSKYKPSNGK
jgi:hypothetical protein